jgi:hypothetical protein
VAAAAWWRAAREASYGRPLCAYAPPPRTPTLLRPPPAAGYAWRAFASGDRDEKGAPLPAADDAAAAEPGTVGGGGGGGDSGDTLAKPPPPLLSNSVAASGGGAGGGGNARRNARCAAAEEGIDRIERFVCESLSCRAGVGSVAADELKKSRFSFSRAMFASETPARSLHDASGACA